jgi:hypothetical protein
MVDLISISDEMWDEVNSRRIELTERLHSVGLQAYEFRELFNLQSSCFGYLNNKFPRALTNLDEIAKLEDRLTAESNPKRWHVLKTWPAQFIAILNDFKKADFRKADRDFRVDDPIAFVEYNPSSKVYTKLWCKCKITHIEHGGNFGIPEGYCMLSINKEEFADRNGDFEEWSKYAPKDSPWAIG